MFGIAKDEGRQFFKKWKDLTLPLFVDNASDAKLYETKREARAEIGNILTYYPKFVLSVVPVKDAPLEDDTKTNQIDGSPRTKLVRKLEYLCKELDQLASDCVHAVPTGIYLDERSFGEDGVRMNEDQSLMVLSTCMAEVLSKFKTGISRNELKDKIIW